MNKKQSTDRKKQILLTFFGLLFLLECSLFYGLDVFFSSNFAHVHFSQYFYLHNELFEYLVDFGIVFIFLFCLLYPSDKSSKKSSQSFIPSSSKHFSTASTVLLQRPHYDPMSDNTNPASSSYFGRFNPRA
jgi:hypothetical protein